MYFNPELNEKKICTKQKSIRVSNKHIANSFYSVYARPLSPRPSMPDTSEFKIKIRTGHLLHAKYGVCRD